MNIRVNKALKAGIWYTICSFIIKGLSFLTMPIFTRMMSKAAIGQYSVLSTWISILGVTVTLGLSNSVIIAKFDYKSKFEGFLSSIAILGLISTGIVYLGVVICMKSVSSYLQIPVYAIHIMFVYLMVSPGMEIMLCKLRTELKYKSVIGLTLGVALVPTVLTIFFIQNMEDKFFARTIGNYIPLIVIDGLILGYIIFKGRNFSNADCKYAMSICMPLIIHHLASNIMHSSDRIMIQQLCDSESVALYSVAYTGGAMVNVLRNSMETAWDPWVFEKIDKGQENSICRYSFAYIVFFEVICVGIVAVAPEVLYLLGGNAYMNAIYVVPPVVMAYMSSMIYSLYGALERYYKDQKYFPLFAAVSAGSNILLNILFIPKFGYVAAAYTTFISCSIECLLHYCNARRQGYAKIYNIKFNIVSMLVCGFIIAIINILYKYISLRYIAIAVVLACVFISCLQKKEVILGYIREFKEQKND